MSFTSLFIKTGVAWAVVSCAYGSVEDVFSGIFDGVAVRSAYSEMRSIHGKLMEYYTANGRYPDPKTELIPFIESEFEDPVEQVMKDPWQTSYLFFGPKLEILCCGPDQIQLTGDDLGIGYPKNVIRPVINPE